MNLRLVMRLAGVTVTSATATALLLPMPANAAPVRCNGVAASITSTKAGAVVRGTARRDVIVARGARSTVYGLNGNDLICVNGSAAGGNGNDVIVGGAGGDRLDGGAGNDTLNGASGPDRLLGGAGRDVIDGG